MKIFAGKQGSRSLILASALLAWLALWPAHGQADSPSRVALVIGNGAYQEAPLRNPVRDARSMSARLSTLGFQVITVENADREAMERAILDFGSRLQSDSTGLFYYAGHGIQSRGHNYLLPVDAAVDSERALRFEAVDVQTILEEMAFAANRINIVILDACRNNPFERRFRGGGRGLAAIDAAGGTLIAYATAPGAVAADGEGDNGLYTSELLAALDVPDLKAEEVFKRVRVGVSERTGGAQIPWESSSLTGDFVFHPRSSAAQAASTASTPGSGDSYETLFWETIKESDNREDFQAYLRQYPQGAFASLARIRVAALGENARGEVLRATGAEALNVALLPFDGWHGGGKLAAALETIETGVTTVIQSEPRLQLVYAPHDTGAKPSMGEAERYWEGGLFDKTPKREAVLAAGRQLGADVVFTYFFRRNKRGLYIAAYLFDIRSGRMLKRDVSLDQPSHGQAKMLTRQLLEELFATG